jgi:hypothetical protein
MGPPAELIPGTSSQRGRRHCDAQPQVLLVLRCWGTRPRKNSEIHIDVSHSRQPLVKGERLVRYEVNTVILWWSPLAGATPSTNGRGPLPKQAESRPAGASSPSHSSVDPKVFGCAAPGDVPGQGNT